MSGVLRLTGVGSYEVDVVGESYYQDALKQIANGERRRRVVAQLVCEKDNPHDTQAVKVLIEGATIGHLSRDMARVHRRQLREAQQPEASAECEAVVVTGKDGVSGVYLDLPYDEDDWNEFSELITPTIKRPFVRRHFMGLSIVALVLMLSGAGLPIGLPLAAYLVYYRLRKWS